MMKKMIGAVFATLLGLGVVVTPRAEALTFDLNCVISGSGCAVDGNDYGSVVLTDDGDGVDIDITLTDGNVLSFYMNYDDSEFSNSSAFTMLSGVGVDVDENAQKPDGFNGFLDLHIPATGTLNSPGGYEDTILLLSTNLDPTDFNFLDTTGTISFAVHIGSLGAGGQDSLFVGSTVIPEPGTLLLIGSGLFGLGWHGRRRSKKLGA